MLDNFKGCSLNVNGFRHVVFDWMGFVIPTEPEAMLDTVVDYSSVLVLSAAQPVSKADSESLTESFG